MIFKHHFSVFYFPSTLTTPSQLLTSAKSYKELKIKISSLLNTIKKVNKLTPHRKNTMHKVLKYTVNLINGDIDIKRYQRFADILKESLCVADDNTGNSSASSGSSN